MQAGTGLSVPWRLLRERVLSPQAAEDAGKSGLIAYAETFKGPGSVSLTLFCTKNFPSRLLISQFDMRFDEFSEKLFSKDLSFLNQALGTESMYSSVL
jgi:hypothetical protein